MKDIKSKISEIIELIIVLIINDETQKLTNILIR